MKTKSFQLFSFKLERSFLHLVRMTREPSQPRANTKKNAPDL